MPTKEIATASISGIDVMDIEDAQKPFGKKVYMQRAVWDAQVLS